jgi:hypothetical protein
VSELGGDSDIAPMRLKGLANEFLVGEWSVCLSRVEEGDAPLDSRVDEHDHFGAIRGRTAVVIHAHAAKPYGGDF